METCENSLNDTTFSPLVSFKNWPVVAQWQEHTTVNATVFNGRRFDSHSKIQREVEKYIKNITIQSKCLRYKNMLLKSYKSFLSSYS